MVSEANFGKVPNQAPQLSDIYIFSPCDSINQTGPNKLLLLPTIQSKIKPITSSNPSPSPQPNTSPPFKNKITGQTIPPNLWPLPSQAHPVTLQHLCYSSSSPPASPLLHHYPYPIQTPQSKHYPLASSIREKINKSLGAKIQLNGGDHIIFI